MPNWQQLLFPESAAPRGSTRGPYTPQVQTGWETGLDSTLVAKAQQLKALAAKEGIDLAITAGHRSREEQARLYAQGRTTPGGIITYAKPGQSRHESGRAIDVVPLKEGKPDWRSTHWGRMGELGQQLGLEWGGTWKRLNDRPHFQLPAGSSAPAAPLDPGVRQDGPVPARAWGQELFATPTLAAAAAPGRSSVVQQIRQEARRQGVDPDLAVAVATQESRLDPGQVGDQGRSLGLFQLQHAAAIDAGIDPRRRGDLARNIRGGVTYLKQGLERFGGNVRQALERHYNRGGDPDYYAHVMQYYPRASPTAAPPPAARDWSQELFATPAPGTATPVRPVPRLASQAPAPPGRETGARAWGQELFASPVAPVPSSLRVSDERTTAVFPALV